MAVLAASCQADDPGGGSSSTSGPREYVAIGDSYTSAPLVPVTDPSDPCMRSTGNYPHLVAERLPDVRLVDVSCSGADTADLVRGQDKGGEVQEPQLDAVSAETDIVTIGIGANDFSVFGRLAAMCVQLGSTDPTGAPCRRSNAEAGGGDRVLDLVPRIQQRVVRAIEAVEARAPDATVVVVDYPRILPPAGTCRDLVPLAEGDYAYVGEVNERLSAAVRAAAEEAGVASVDVYAASTGHDVCSAEPWVAGAATVPGQALLLHPFAREQEAVAELVLAEL